MVDGYESPGGENEPEDQNSRRTIQKVEEERPNDRVSSQPPATTTISTIAVQSGDTRLVIALLQSGEWLRLKVLEVQPGLTKLGASAEEATELLNAHDEVLLQLQSKQSPVEELLRQADQLISTQRPRAEVYAAMAETLGQAWRDVNAHLEHRKQILDSNVLFQCRAEEYRERMKALEMACNDTLLPIEIDAVKNFLTRIHDLRKNMLESLMTALQEGKTLLDKLKEVSNEGTLDSRPDQIKLEADHAILQVERWLEELHDKRRLIEVSFQSRKTQLEQCLALALLATDLRDLEEILNDRIAALASSSDQLGDSSASAELLLFELKKLQPEAKDFQDKSIKITKSTEQLVSSGHFAGEQATEQAYAILSAAADYLNDLDQYETLLNKAISFFRLAQSALTKLDQLEIQLITTEHPPHSAQLAQLHSQAVTMLEDVTAEPLVEGYALIDVTGRGAPGAEGVKRMVEELENRKIQLTNHCTAHKEESLRISQGLTTFLEKYNELYSWLVSIAEAFLQGHQDMGSVLPMAKDFYQLHYQLLSDLQKKGDEINETLKILPPIIEHIDDDQRRDVNNKVDLLHDDWLKLKNIIDARLDLSSLYVKFQEAVADLANEIDSIEYEFKKNSDTLNDEKIEELERKWFALQPLYLKLTASGKQFMDEARKITDPYLDISRACLCVETLMEHFANRQLTVSESWENWQTTITILKEKQIEQKRNVEESTKTLEWVSKFEEQLYPVITSESTKVSNILVDLESSQVSILPELKKAVTELNYRIKSVDALTQKGDDGVSEQIRRKLSEVYEHLQTTTSEYQILLESLISIFKNLEEVEKKTEDAKRLRQSPNLSKDVQEVRFMLKEHENTRQFVVETLKSIERETDRTITKIRQQEPPEAAQQDVDKLKRVIVLEKSSWESSWSEKKSQLEEQLQLCIFDEDVNQINSNLTTLSKQLGTLKGQYKESLPAAKCASESFVKFEKTVMTLEEKIETFIKTTTETISTIYTSAPQVRNELSNLKERWQDLKKQAEDTRKCVDLSIEYFKLLEEAEEWFREGSKLLVTIARKATTVKVPEDATNLLHDVDAYLKPGEEKQDERIRKIRELSTYVFGTDRLSQFNKVIVENREMLDSFTVISSELRTLVQNLKNAEDLRDTLRKEQEEADVKLNAARAEVMVAQAAAAEAENARKVAEILAAQTVEKATEEARRLGEVEAKKAMRAQIEKQKKILTSVSAQTEATDTEVVRETVTSAVTTKEIHILQKTEVEEAIPLPARLFTPKREASPPKKTKLEEAPPVPVPPQFTVPLSNATIQEGERLTFECQLTGFPEPEIVWYKDGISILNNPDYLTNYDHGICTLTIEETFAEDSAQFTCRAFNVAGSTETAATLKVKEIAPEEQLSPPTFSKELQASLATEGTTHQLECRVEGNPLPTVQWFKNESNIDNSPDYIITYNNGEAVLKFEEVFLEDQATYTCKATNQVGQASTFASLSVEPLEPSEKPYFVVPLSNIMARAGQKVKLECEARGIPCPNLSWTHNGKFIKESRDVKIQTEGAKSTLVISEAFPKDAGSYVVSARNLAGEAISSCNVSVKGRLPNETSDSELASDMEPVKPSIQLPLKNVQVFEGQTVRLDCVIIGQPEPEVIWYHDGQPVKESADFQLLFQGDRCSLIIHEAFLDDAGEYKVVAINSGGEASSKCMLSVTLVEAEENLKSQVEKVPAGTPPKFIKLLTDVLVAEGEDTLFECMIIGEPKPELKWFLNNNEIVENERIKTTYGEDGTCILKISPTVPEDRGNYIAKATNNLGEAKAFAHLIVKSLSDFQRKEELIQMEEKHVPPMFKERFEERKVFEGSATKFECIVTGRPTPKIQWLFNDQPVCGKDFLISVSGDRQVLTIPETKSDQVGTVSCVAENIAGKATCTAKLKIDRGTNEELELIQVPPDEMQASSSSEKHFSKEKTSSEGGSESILTKMSSTITESSSVHTSTKKEYTSSSTTSSTIVPGQQPTSVCMKTTTHSTEQSSSENGAPPVVQSHKVEEYERIVQDKPGEIRQEKTVIVSKGEEGTKQESKLIQIQKPCRKSTAPKFVSPVTGMIVDQGADIVLEGIVDGYPQPTITWSKNGQELKQRNGVKISYAHNHVRVELKNVNVKDAGRYTCTAINDVGTANSTADLVVKKTIFPPVFGRRLQAQVVKRGDRVIMEVEITGTPEPTVTWYKNDVPIKEQPPEVRIRQQGNCYLLVIEKVEKEHAGKYMVHAVNTGGEAQSIADFAVFEPTPDTMVEVHKTVVYENVKDKGIVQPDGKKGEVPSANLTTEHISTTTIQPSSGLKILTSSLSPNSLSTIRTVETIGTSQPTTESKTTRSETISSTIESHRSETKSEQKFHMKMEHKTAPLFEYESTSSQTASEQTPDKQTMSSATNTAKEVSHDITTQTAATKVEDKSTEVVENENVETSTIAKKDALSFFESKSKESEAPLKGPKEMIKLAEDVGPGYDVKVDKLTKNYERSTKFEELKKTEQASDFQATKKAVRDIFTKIEQGPSPRGIDNKLINFPFEEYKLPPLEIKHAILEDTTASGSPIHGTLTISKLQAQSESAEAMMSGFNLKPEPPPEIGYMPKVDVAKKKHPDISIKAKQLQESHKNLSPVEAPIGGVKIFPSPAPKAEPVKVQTPKSRPPSTVIPPPFELERKEVVEEVCVKKDVREKRMSREETKMETSKFAPATPVTSNEGFTTDKLWSYVETSGTHVKPTAPSPVVQLESSYASDLETRSHVSTDLSEYRCHSAASSSHADRPSSPKPSADALAMEKSWARKYTDTSKKSWPPQDTQTTAQKQWLPGQDFKTSSHEVRSEVKETPSGYTTTNIESSNSLENKSWSTREQHITKKIVEEQPPPRPVPRPIIYNAETIKVDHTVNRIEQQSVTEKYSSAYDIHKKDTTMKSVHEQREIKPPEVKKSWPPGLGHTEELKAPQLVKSAIPKPVVQLYHAVEPVEPILEPGPPPEMGYVPGPVVREKMVERIEKSLEMTLEHQPTKIPPGAVRTMPPPHRREEPPPIPPKDAYVTPPPIPAKYTDQLLSRATLFKPIERFPDLEPFPYQPEPPAPKAAKVPPPPTPTKFIKGSFGESDYESDFEAHLKPKWRPYESDNEEPRYRRVKAPVLRQPTRPRSTEPEPLPPSSFEIPPPEFTGPPRPTVTREYQERTSKKTMTRHERDMKHQQQLVHTVQTPPILEPGSPPVYVQPKSPRTPPILAPKSPTKVKPESPKFKVRTFQQESGYMADTDEPFQQRAATVHKNFTKHEGSSSSHSESHTSYSESQQFIKSQTFTSSQQKKESSSSAFSPIPSKTQVQRSSFVEKTSSVTGTGPAQFKPAKETVHTVTQSSQQQTLEKRLEPFPYKAADYPRPIPKKVPPPPSPSKFVKGEFRESDYESDYEGRIPPVWKPHGSDNEDYAFKHVIPNLVGTGKLRPTSTEPLPTPPTVFDNPPQYSGPPRPEFKPLDKVIKDTKQTEKKQLLTQKTKSISPQPKLEIVPTTPTKQKSVLLPGSPPEIGYAPPKQQTFYEGRSGAPFHNAIGTETKKTVRMDESTENTRRILTVEQTSRVIKFGENQNTQNKYSSYDKSSSQQQNRHSVPIPKKFVQGQFRESDYESDADIKIRPKWTPTDSDTEDLHYRKVQAPRSSRSSSVPTQRERVQTPMEFDTQPPVIPQQTIFTQHLQDVNVENRRLQRLEEMRKKFDSQTQVVKQQTSESNQKQEILKLGSPPEFGYVTKNDVKKAANYVASKHISDMTSSFKSKTEKFVKDIQSDLKQKPILKHPPDSQTADGDDTQAYREETRLAQYGTKHIDPDTGLIYFKYDFGYEFGIVLPGEGKKTVSSSSKTIQGQRRASDIDVPIIHEFTTKKENGFAKPSSQFKPSRFTNSKTVKWEPNSESEFSEAEDTRNRKRHSLPQTNFSAPSVVIPTTRWDQTTPSPVSLSPSLPSLSPHHSSVGPPSNVDSAGSPWPSNGVPTAKEVIQPYHDVLPKKAPLFITPLRDIAVVSGQTARFECIVQAEPQPNILWSKDGRIIENSSNYEIQYRNGVCRLTIPRAYPEDAGAYSCTATNGLGSTGTSATLQVPGNRRSIYSNK